MLWQRNIDMLLSRSLSLPICTIFSFLVFSILVFVFVFVYFFKTDKLVIITVQLLFLHLEQLNFRMRINDNGKMTLCAWVFIEKVVGIVYRIRMRKNHSIIVSAEFFFKFFLQKPSYSCRCRYRRRFAANEQRLLLWLLLILLLLRLFC